MGTLALILVPAAVFVAAVAIVLAIRRPGPRGMGRPWWAIPAVWVGLGLVSILAGLLVFPRLLGFTFLFLPLIWMRAFGRRRPRDRGR
jgi:hypothetical protein